MSNGTRRTIVWDEENRIQEVSDHGHTKTYKYDDAGERVIKRGPQGETAYVNQFYTIRNREVGTKHVFAGGTRLVSKLVKAPNVIDLDGDGIPDDIANACSEPWGWTNGAGNPNGNGQDPCNNNVNGGQNGNGGNNSTGPEVFEKVQYDYHPDHLGSSSYATDLDGEIFQHLEYFQEASDNGHDRRPTSTMTPEAGCRFSSCAEMLISRGHWAVAGSFK